MKIAFPIVTSLLLYSLALRAQQPESPTPSTSETLAYINQHLTPGQSIEVNGMMVSVDFSSPHEVYKKAADVLDLGLPIDIGDPNIPCLDRPGEDWCIKVYPRQMILWCARDHPSCWKGGGANYRVVLMCTDTVIRPHVANALRHLIALLQQEHTGTQF
jgi:hypothetical protein